MPPNALTPLLPNPDEETSLVGEVMEMLNTGGGGDKSEATTVTDDVTVEEVDEAGESESKLETRRVVGRFEDLCVTAVDEDADEMEGEDSVAAVTVMSGERGADAEMTGGSLFCSFNELSPFSSEVDDEEDAWAEELTSSLCLDFLLSLRFRFERSSLLSDDPSTLASAVSE